MNSPYFFYYVHRKNRMSISAIFFCLKKKSRNRAKHMRKNAKSRVNFENILISELDFKVE